MENNNKKTDPTNHTTDVPLFSLTCITSDNNHFFGKLFEKNSDGDIVKTSEARLKKGSFEVKHFYSASVLSDFLDNLQSDQALSIGIPHQNNMELSSGRITARSIYEEGAINRTTEYFMFGNTLVFDIDDSDLEIDEVIPALIKIDPNLASAPLLVRASSSCGVHSEGDVNIGNNKKSYHVYGGGIEDGTDINRYGKTFAKWCWFYGLGAYIKVSKKGAMLERQLIDAAVFSPERLVFEAKPTLGKGLSQTAIPSIIQEAS